MTRQSESHWPLTILLGLASLFNLLLPLILIRILTPDQVGTYKLFFLYTVTLPWILFAWGFSKGIYFWGGHWRNDPVARFQSFSATWSFQICWSLLILFLGALTIPVFYFFPQFLFTDPLYIFLIILSIAFSVPSTLYEEYCVAHGKSRAAGAFTMAWDLLRVTAILSSALYFRSIIAVFVANLFVLILKFSVNAAFVFKNKIATFSLKNNPQAKAVWDYAIPSSATSFLAICFGYGDQFILGHYLSPAEFALYSFGCLVIPPLFVFEATVNKMMIPHLTRAMADNLSMAWKKIRFATMDLGLWLIPSAVGLFFFAGPITRMLFTDKYPATEYFLKMYSLYYLFHIIPYDAWERAQGRTAWMLKTTGVLAAFSLITSWIGAKFFNAYIVLAGFLFWQLSLRIYSLFTMKKRLGWKITQTVPAIFIARALAVSVVLGFATQWLATKQTELFGYEVLALFVWGIVFWIIYISTFVPWALKKERKERNSKKVLILTQYLNIGGLERMIFNLSHELRRLGEWEPSVFVYDSLKLPGIKTLDSSFSGVKIHRMQKKEGFSLKTVFQIVKLTREEGIDHIHAHDMGPLIYAVLAKLLSFGRLRVVYTLHSFVHFNQAAKYKIYEKVFTYFVDQIVVVSEQLQTIYADNGINRKRVKIIENGVPFPEKLNSTQEKIKLKARLIPGKENFYWIMCLARLHSGKGQLECLQIWNQLPLEIREKCILVFVGGETEPGHLKKIEAAKDLSQSLTHIILAGATLDPDPWLQASDMLLSASLQEGLPLAPLEGLALKIPVVLSDIPGHEMFKGYAKLFPVNNFQAAGEIITMEVQNPQTPQDPEVLLQRFSVERMARNYMKVYEEN